MSWYDYFQNAAEQATEEDRRRTGFDRGVYLVDDAQTVIRRDAVATLFSEPMRSAPPSDYAWPRQPESVGVVSSEDFVEGIPRRAVSRQADLWYNPCPVNTTYELGWFTMRGFEPAQPAPTPKGCPPPLLFIRR